MPLDKDVIKVLPYFNYNKYDVKFASYFPIHYLELLRVLLDVLSIKYFVFIELSLLYMNLYVPCLPLLKEV